MAIPDDIAALATHPLAECGAGLVLQCDDGEVAVMRDMFKVVSPFFGQLLSSTDERVVKVPGTTREQWLLLISQLYPLTPLPDLTPKQLGKVLPVAHK
ncbi:hypothetical protein HaLaN_14779 [Haematococcus lacustris]|uniref:BTB domain-containing protein n=1 Tax=Haematococcus lacustris TaxID=44745 RepID=A0A699Z654_HAELA|nr:hypothetical protein HaLaN_14779 [Haematococcus lacustris]